jgi:hypothetical protein
MSQVFTYNERVGGSGNVEGDLVFTETLNCGLHECEFTFLSEMDLMEHDAHKTLYL